jgi:hypothetical protein
MTSFVDAVSGTTKWEAAVSAISTMVSAFDDEIQLGLDLFNVGTEYNDCTIAEEVLTDVAPLNGETIVGLLAAEENYPYRGATPLLAAMTSYTLPLYAPIFQDGNGQSFLVVISDGRDTCGLRGSHFVGAPPVDAELTELTGDLRANHEINSIAIGFGDAIDEAELNAIAAFGGTEFTEYLDAQDGEQLQSVLNTIGESILVSCVYEIGAQDPDEVDLDLVNVRFDGVPVPRDDNCAAATGWTWTDENRDTIQFCEAACTQLNASVSQITGEIACAEDDVIIIII